MEPRSLKELVQKRMEAVNRGDRETVLSMYGPDSVIALNDEDKVAGIDAIRAWSAKLQATMLHLRCLYSLDETDTGVTMHWAAVRRDDNGATVASGIDRFTGDARTILTQEADFERTPELNAIPSA